MYVFHQLRQILEPESNQVEWKFLKWTLSHSKILSDNGACMISVQRHYCMAWWVRSQLSPAIAVFSKQTTCLPKLHGYSDDHAIPFFNRRRIPGAEEQPSSASSELVCVIRESRLNQSFMELVNAHYCMKESEQMIISTLGHYKFMMQQCCDRVLRTTY